MSSDGRARKARTEGGRLSPLMVALLLGLGLGLGLWLPVVGGAAAQGGAGTPAAGSGPARTDIRFFVPVGPDGLRPGLEVVAEAGGSCFAGSSAAATRPDAWRCGVDNGILDPCFADPFLLPGETGVLYCAEDPFSRDLIELTLTEPLPEEGGNDLDPLPNLFAPGFLFWALELATGEECTLLTGATAPIAGRRLNYLCEGGASVVGLIDQSQPLWVVDVLAEDGYATTRVGVATAWS